jgi:hypothetical protein
MCALIKIHYCKRNEIDSEKWNSCIENAPNGLIYSYSFYLDALCDNWDALIIDDYKAVMPLPWRKKAGLKYLYAPPFIQQLGITGIYETGFHSEVLELVKKNFRYGDLFFNYANINLPISLFEKTNFILPLNKSYEELAAQFSNDLKKNLKAAVNENIIYSSGYQHQSAINLFKKMYESRMPHIAPETYERFSALCDQLKTKNNLVLRAIINEKEEMLAIALLLKDDKRIINLMNSTTPVGRKAKANHYLLTQIIKEFSKSNLLFDFEGSDLPGVKEFYENFNPINQPYYHYHFNRLPFPLNLIKK